MFAGQQVVCGALPEQMEGACAPLYCDLMGSDVCMCVQCSKCRLHKHCILCIQVLLVGNNEISQKWTRLQGLFWKLSGRMQIYITAEQFRGG